eukprot:6206125-Pleurochrysis_carterae.AAC.4
MTDSDGKSLWVCGKRTANHLNSRGRKSRHALQLLEVDELRVLPFQMPLLLLHQHPGSAQIL